MVCGWATRRPTRTLKYAFAASCPRIGAASMYDRCGVYYPELVQIMGARKPPA